MPLAAEVLDQVRSFLQASRFGTEGLVITDLDGTAVHEDQGRVYIPEPVEFGLKRLRDLGRQVVINSLRFPLSVMRAFGKEWYRITGAPVPTISLNGSLLGYVRGNSHGGDGELVYEELAAFPLTKPEIGEVLRGVKGLLDGGVEDIILFYYPRDWTAGEIIWTPRAERSAALAAKYLSAASVISVPFEELRDLLAARDICMMLLLIDVPQDKLMAYQHTKRSSFFSRKDVDKLSGARAMAGLLGADLDHSVGAGDTELDTFLGGVGLSIQVGGNALEFKGKLQTVKVRDSFELGEMLFSLADMKW